MYTRIVCIVYCVDASHIWSVKSVAFRVRPKFLYFYPSVKGYLITNLLFIWQLKSQVSIKVEVKIPHFSLTQWYLTCRYVQCTLYIRMYKYGLFTFNKTVRYQRSQHVSSPCKRVHYLINTYLNYWLYTYVVCPNRYVRNAT